MTAEEKAKAYAKKRIVLENRDKFSDEANLRAAEYFAYKAYLDGYNQKAKDLSENKFNPDDYECLAGVCPDLSDEEHCENCSLKRLKRSTEPKEALRWRDPKDELPTTGEPVIVKYTTARGVEKYGIGRYFELGIGNPWTIEGSTGREVIGWRPIE